MTPDRRDPETPDRPSTEAARTGGTTPAVGAGGTSEPGASPGDVSLEDASGRERRRLTQDAAVTAADHDSFWRKSFGNRPYTDESRGYEHYRPAYRYGWESRERHGERAFEDVEGDLEAGWDPESKGLGWDEARPAVRDAYGRQDNTDASTPGNPLA